MAQTSNPSNVIMDTSDDEAAVPSGVTPQAPQAPAQVYKRKVVDEFGNEVPDSKRNRAVPNNQLKLNVLKLILHWHEYLRGVFKIKERTNIDDLADVTAVIQTVHTKFRQDSNGVGALKDKIGDAFEFTAAGKSTTYLAIKVHMRTLATKYGFHYASTDADKKAIGTLSSILGLIVAYRHRFTESRLGNTCLIFRKQGGVDETMDLSRFGLSSSHCSSLQGCRFTPAIQSAMKQSLGPLTIALNLCMNTDPRYQRAWTEAFVQAFKLVPGVEDIARILAGSRTNCRALLKLLADISLFGVTRTSNKAFFPGAMLINFVAQRHPGYRERYNPCTELTPLIDDDMIPINLINLDFSGHGALHFWNESSAYAYAIRGNPAVLDRDIASQMVFHAVFGTHKENLNLVDWMTGHKFFTRREIGDKLKGRSVSGLTVRVNIISFRYFSKMASASMSELLKGGMGQVARGPTFSGKFSEDLDPDRDFFKVVQTANSTLGAVGQITEAKLIAMLQDLKDNMIQDLQKRRVMEYGTTLFYEPIPGGNGKEYGAEANGPGNLAPKYLYQQD